MKFTISIQVILYFACFPYTHGFTSINPVIHSNPVQIQSSNVNINAHDSSISMKRSSKSRRSFVKTCVSVSGLLLGSTFVPTTANAGIDPNALKALPVEGDASGVATRLRQIEAERNRPEDAIDKPWEKLDDGVQFREYREGRGEISVEKGSRVAVEMTIRCKSFATAQEPGGVKYFSTKEDTDFNEIAFTIGNGEIIPELEEGMMGMKKGSVRRIEIPTEFVYAAKKLDQLPLPSEKNKDGKRRFESLFKTDATLIFEVLVTRIK